MSERKNHLTIDGGQVQEDEHVASYKPLPESDAGEFRSSKASLHKSKEKVDEAEEKLLEKEDEAKIVTRVDMADAKYVVGDHRNGDAKIELDANKRQFSGLTKEELLRYADDPFWVRLRWIMFILFWALWLCMLAGAILIIVQAPKCAPPPPRTWFEKGPLVEMMGMSDDDAGLPQSSHAAGIFTAMACGEDPYHVLTSAECVERFKKMVAPIKDRGLKVILDLWANYVDITHEWFKLSENRSAGYEDYFIWENPKGYDAANAPNPPNDWVAFRNGPAWSYSEARKQFYLHQVQQGTADLNFGNPAVVKQFDNVLKIWMKAGADGVRLDTARLILVNSSLLPEQPAPATDALGRGAALSDYQFWRHQHSADAPGLDALLAHWSQVVEDNSASPGAGETVFTLRETGNLTELFLLDRNLTGLRPQAAAPLPADAAPADVAAKLKARLPRWPALQLTTASGGDELAAFALLLPAAPVLNWDQLVEANDTTETESLSRLVALRSDASIEHGRWHVQAVPARDDSATALAVARWKAGHTGYVAVWNPSGSRLRADLSKLPAVPAKVTVHRVSPAVKMLTNYTSNLSVDSNDVAVPAAASVVLSFVPKTEAEE
ncbi:CD98 heavy chain isoform X1 [Choristoneura fumiferana]|uniref:CD98 heavy chain isoform X1 n=2 Tax=Choristoneura fumiferana TaxID=7141 RepID=UPI003D159B37